jgi:hypothetical protein
MKITHLATLEQTEISLPNCMAPISSQKMDCHALNIKDSGTYINVFETNLNKISFLSFSAVFDLLVCNVFLADLRKIKSQGLFLRVAI